MPSKEEIESSIEKYVNINLLECLNSHNYTLDTSFEEPLTTATIHKKHVSFIIYSQVSITEDNNIKIINLNEKEIIQDSYLESIIEIAEYLTEYHKVDPKYFCINCLSELAIEKNKAKVKEHLQKRLHSYYLMGKTGILNVTFSTRTLPDLMLFNDSFMTLLDYDKVLFDQYRETIDQLTQARDAHEKESILLNEFIANAVKQQQELDILVVEKRQLLEKVKTQKILHEQAVKELKKAEEILNKCHEMGQTIAAGCDLGIY